MSKTFDMELDPENLNYFINRLTDIYTNPIEAAVREIISNAMDTTVKISLQDRKPIKVSLPTEDNLYFTVQDYGTGMATEEIENILRYYGKSTKVNDPNSIGSYGLGFKAPLFYTNSFNIISIKDGEKISATIERLTNKNTINISDVEKTDELNGTTIIIPLKNKNDIFQFKQALNKYVHIPKDIEMTVDNVPFSGSEELVKVSEYFYDRKNNIVGDIFIKKSDIGLFFNHVIKNNSVLNPDYIFVLGGWGYNSNQYSYSLIKLYVELYPKILDFNTSRDSIVSNNKMETLLKDLTVSLTSQFNINKNYASFVEIIRNHYQSLSNVEALNFFKNMDNVKISYDEDNNNISIKNYYNDKTFSQDIFINNNSFNPIVEYFLDSNDKKVINSVLLKDKDSGYTIFDNSIFITDIVSQGHFLNNITDKNKFLKNKNIEKTIRQTIIDTFIKSQNNNFSKKHYFIEDSDKTVINKFINNRKYIEKELGSSYFHFVNSSINEDEKLFLEEILNSNFTILKNNDFISDVNKYRKKYAPVLEKKNRVSVGDTIIKVTAIPKSYNFYEVFEKVYLNSNKNLFLKDLVSSDNIVIIYDNANREAIKNTLIYIANHNMDLITSKNIYYVESSSIYSNMISSLNTCDNIYTSVKTPFRKGAKIEEFFINHYSYADKLEEELNIISLNDFIFNLIKNDRNYYSWMSEQDIDYILNEFNEKYHYNEDFELEKNFKIFFNELRNIRRYDNINKISVVSKYNFEDLSKITSKRQYSLFKYLFDNLRKDYSYKTIDSPYNKLLFLILENHDNNEIDDNIKDSILNVFFKNLSKAFNI